MTKKKPKDEVEPELRREFDKKQEEWARPFLREDNPQRYDIVMNLMRDGLFIGRIVELPTKLYEKHLEKAKEKLKAKQNGRKNREDNC